MSPPSDGDPFTTLSDDTLIATGADLETRRFQLSTAIQETLATTGPDTRKLRIAGLKLPINATFGLLGVAGAPVTLGLSLLLTLGGAIMLAWDGVDFARELSTLRAARRRHGLLRAQIIELDTALAVLTTELDRRTRGS